MSDTADKSNRMPNILTHTHTYTHCSQICRVFTQQTCNQSNRFFLPEQKKSKSSINEIFFEKTAR